jgi:hypothetical protein
LGGGPGRVEDLGVSGGVPELLLRDLREGVAALDRDRALTALTRPVHDRQVERATRMPSAESMRHDWDTTGAGEGSHVHDDVDGHEAS